MEKNPLPGTEALSFIPTCLLLAIILFLSSCNKLDCLTADPRNGNMDYKQCVIRELFFSNDDAENPYKQHYVMAYNDRRDPISGTPDGIGTGSSQRVFYYDKKGRLIVYAGLYTGGQSFEFWHNYFYDQKGRIVGDSVYIFGFVGQLGSAGIKSYSALFYDQLNRIIREEVTPSRMPELPPPTVITYQYDASGNLAGRAHDDKVNFLLTNKVWRFINRDYSINNPVVADAYNDHGLPTAFTTPVNEVPTIFENTRDGESHLVIKYDCGGL